METQSPIVWAFLWSIPSVDLSASSVNYQLKTLSSSNSYNCFLPWMEGTKCYAFPQVPLIIMNRLLQKVKQDAPSLVPKTITPLNWPCSSHKGSKDTYTLTHQGESTPSESTFISCMRVIWNSPTVRGISGNAISVILQSWRGSTHNHLLTNFIYLKKWLFFRGSRDLNPCKATPLQSLDLMTDLLEVE